jgi:hypothetical protein
MSGRRYARGRNGGQRNVVIRREEIVHHTGHSGAWKVAYADFVTAMMAFFLAAQRDDGGAAEGPRRLFQPDQPAEPQQLGHR